MATSASPPSGCRLLLMLLPLVTLVHGKYYIDTGFQHVLQSFDTGQKEELEDQILDILGLHHRPKPQASRPRSAPKLLLDLYNTVLHEDHAIHSNGVRVDGQLLPQRIQSAIQEADKIVSFADQKHGKPSLPSHTCVTHSLPDFA